MMTGLAVERGLAAGEPARRGELKDPLLGMRVHPADDIRQVFFRVDAQTDARVEDGIKHSSALGGFLRAKKQVVLSFMRSSA